MKLKDSFSPVKDKNRKNHELRTKKIKNSQVLVQLREKDLNEEELIKFKDILAYDERFFS